MKQSTLIIICIIAVVAFGFFVFPSFIKFILSTLIVLIYLLLGIFTSAVVMEATTKDSFISKYRILSVTGIVLFWPLFYFYSLCAIIYKIIEIKLQNQ